MTRCSTAWSNRPSRKAAPQPQAWAGPLSLSRRTPQSWWTARGSATLSSPGGARPRAGRRRGPGRQAFSPRRSTLYCRSAQCSARGSKRAGWRWPPSLWRRRASPTTWTRRGPGCRRCRPRCTWRLPGRRLRKCPRPSIGPRKSRGRARGRARAGARSTKGPSRQKGRWGSHPTRGARARVGARRTARRTARGAAGAQRARDRRSRRSSSPSETRPGWGPRRGRAPSCAPPSRPPRSGSAAAA
mmetsp:Transcript_31700/g.71296  ORF Transcript_31700/g.71296 Transcript_31700/m.71296 type:complete len:243 (+) Transcript_31700:120-848(+)